MRTSIIHTLLLCGTFLVVPNVHASLLVNGSFETGNFRPNGQQTTSLPIGSGAMTGWTVIDDSLAWIGAGNPFGLTASDGARFLDLTDYAPGGQFGGVSQLIPTVAGATYALSFDLGSSTTYGRPSAITASAAGATGTFTSALQGGNNDWDRFSMQFVASASTTTVSLLGAIGRNYIGLDNVSVDVVAAPVPEPASIAVWSLLGMVTFGGCYWRKRKQ